MNYRAAYISPLQAADYDNLAPLQAQLAGTPEYELFSSLASISQARVDNFRAAWPDAYLIAYLILYNLPWDPDEPTYGSLTQVLPDRWLRTTGGDLIPYQVIFGHYFWNDSAVINYLIPWLTETGALKSWTTKFDGFFLDNLPWQMPFGSYQTILSNNGGAVKVAGDTYTDALDLYDLYFVGGTSQSITSQIKNIDPNLVVIRNAASYSNAGQTLPYVLDDPNANGLLWEPIENNNAGIVFTQSEWDDPKFGIQFVSSDANYATIQGLTWPDGQFFGQGPSLTGRL